MQNRLLGIALLAAAGCGGEEADPSQDTSPDATPDVAEDGSGTPDVVEEVGVDVSDAAGDADSGPADSTAPRLRDVRTSIDGAVSTDVDLNGGDVEVILPSAAVAAFTVFASDDISDSDALTVDFVDADGEPVAPTETSFRNGLWTAAIDVAPGMHLRARVSDEAGNEVIADAALVVPAIEDALLGDWATRRFGLDQTQIGVRHHEWTTGEWSEEEGDYAAAGTWSFDGEFITVVTTETTAGDTPILRSDVYVDEFYFSIGPMRQQSGSESGIVGTWTTTSWMGETEVERTVELSLGDDDQFTWTDGDSYAAGSWRTEVNEDYSEAFGNFLVLDVSSRDGAELAEVEVEISLYRRRGDALLISPQLRVSDE